jgi:hypothetical protein
MEWCSTSPQMDNVLYQGHRLQVTIEAPVGDQATTKINELKSSLRDLGLDENIESSAVSNQSARGLGRRSAPAFGWDDLSAKAPL